MKTAPGLIDVLLAIMLALTWVGVIALLVYG